MGELRQHSDEQLIFHQYKKYYQQLLQFCHNPSQLPLLIITEVNDKWLNLWKIHTKLEVMSAKVLLYTHTLKANKINLVAKHPFPFIELSSSSYFLLPGESQDIKLQFKFAGLVPSNISLFMFSCIAKPSMNLIVYPGHKQLIWDSKKTHSFHYLQDRISCY